MLAKIRKQGRANVDTVTLELLEKPGGIARVELHAALLRKFPLLSSLKLWDNTSRRLNGYLQYTYNVKINLDEKGKYSI